MRHVRVPAFTTASALDLISPQSVAHMISLGTMIIAETETSNIRHQIRQRTDSLGRTQPVHRDPDRGTYMINHLSRRSLANGASGASDMVRNAARVAVERSGRLPRHKADS